VEKQGCGENMNGYEIERLGTGKQYAIWGTVLSVIAIASVMIYHFCTYGLLPLTENEINTMTGVPCFIFFDLGVLFTLENLYL
jgi:hypothetical protein